MIRIRLGKDDREALGAPEWFEIDPEKMRLSEVRALERETGLSVEDLAEGLKGRQIRALAALVWVGLHRAGVRVAFDDLDFSFADLDLEVEDPNSSAPQGASPPS